MSVFVPFALPRRDLTGSLSEFHGRAVSNIAFTQVAEDVERACVRLRAASVEPGMLIGILGENCYEWMIHDLALMSLGALPVCFPVDEFAGKSAEELAGAYDLSLLLVTKQVGNRDGHPWVLVMNEAGSAGAVRTPADNGLRRRIAGTDVCTVIFSSGTSGQLKALLLSRAGVEVVIASLVDDWSMGPGDGILVALPLSIFQQRLMVYAALRTGTDILLTDSANLFRAFKTLRPTIILGPPALFEVVEKRFDAMPRWRLRALAALSVLLAVAPSGVRARWRRRLFREAHEAFGGRVRVLITGSAPSKRSTLSLYGHAGLPLYQAYGLAEVGFIAWNRPGRNRLQSVGRPVVPGSVTIADDGEILITLPQPQSIGYFGIDSDEERRTFLPDGRIATGDLGRIDRNGFLHITGRKKNLILLQSGEKIQPEPIETPLAAIAGVERAVVMGGGELPGLVAVLAIDPEAGAEEETRIRAEAQAAVDALNARVKLGSRVTRFILTRVPFRPETSLVTRNLKLDRKAVARYFEKEFCA